MKNYIAPELEVSKFAFEDIITVSGGTGEQASIAVSESNGGVAAFTNGSLSFTDNNQF